MRMRTNGAVVAALVSVLSVGSAYAMEQLDLVGTWKVELALIEVACAKPHDPVFMRYGDGAKPAKRGDKWVTTWDFLQKDSNNLVISTQDLYFGQVAKDPAQTTEGLKIRDLTLAGIYIRTAPGPASALGAFMDLKFAPDLKSFDGTISTVGLQSIASGFYCPVTLSVRAKR